MKHGNYGLKHMVLTTPFALTSEDATQEYDLAWQWCEAALRKILYISLDNKGMLSKTERRRQRVDLKAHDIGAIVAAEYGHEGHKLHFHILIYAPYMGQKEIIQPVWYETTKGRAKVAWIKAVHDANKGVRELTKYVTKFDAIDPTLIPALAEILHGRRRFRAYGVWNGLEEIEKEIQTTCKVCGHPLSQVKPETYFEQCEKQGIEPEREIVRDWERFLDFCSDMEISPGKKDRPP